MAIAAVLKGEERRQAEGLLAAWVAASGCRPHDPGRWCLQKLANPRHRCGRRCFPWGWPDILDHAEWWRAPDGAHVVTAHPYWPYGDKSVDELRTLARGLGARLSIFPDRSWYYPGATALIVLWGTAK